MSLILLDCCDYRIAGNCRGVNILISWASWPPRNFNVGVTYWNVGMQCSHETKRNFYSVTNTTVFRVERIFYPTKLPAIRYSWHMHEWLHVLTVPSVREPTNYYLFDQNACSNLVHFFDTNSTINWMWFFHAYTVMVVSHDPATILFFNHSLENNNISEGSAHADDHPLMQTLHDGIDIP